MAILDTRPSQDVEWHECIEVVSGPGLFVMSARLCFVQGTMPKINEERYVMTYGQAYRVRVAAFSLALVTACCVGFSLSPAVHAEEVDYCGVYVPAYTNCAKTSAKVGYVVGRGNRNKAHAQYNPRYVCEGVYINGTTTTVSHKCEYTTAESSFCEDSWEQYYNLGYEFSFHVANESAYEELIWGHAANVEGLKCV